MTPPRKKPTHRAAKKRVAETEGPTTHRPFATIARERGAASRSATRDTTSPEGKGSPETRSPHETRSSPETRRAERFADLVPWVEPIARGRRVAAPRAATGTPRTELRFEVIDDGGAVEGRRVDLDPRALGRMKRGEHPCDARVDLHGLSAIDARRAVEAFLVRAAAEGALVVEIIHGKGTHSIGGVGVLRGELGAWLSQGVAARVVLAFASVRESRGEAGRLRVLLGSRAR